jgi:hypothetical protein
LIIAIPDSMDRFKQMEHERYDEDDNHHHCRWRVEEAKSLFDPRPSSPSHDIPRNILMLDSPDLSDFHDTAHPLEHIESKDSGETDRGMTPIPLADDTRQQGNEECHHVRPPLMSLPSLNFDVTFKEILTDDGSYSYSSGGYHPYYAKEHGDRPQLRTNSFYACRDSSKIPCHSFHPEVPQYGAYYPMASLHDTNSHYYLGHPSSIQNPWVHKSISTQSVKGMDHPPNQRVVSQRTLNMIDEGTNSNEYTNKYRNPRYVIRASYKAFARIKYQLPCLRSAREICPVTISALHGSIRHYTNKNNKTIENQTSVSELENCPHKFLCTCYHKQILTHVRPRP